MISYKYKKYKTIWAKIEDLSWMLYQFMKIDI